MGLFLYYITFFHNNIWGILWQFFLILFPLEVSLQLAWLPSVLSLELGNLVLQTFLGQSCRLGQTSKASDDNNTKLHLFRRVKYGEAIRQLPCSSRWNSRLHSCPNFAIYFAKDKRRSPDSKPRPWAWLEHHKIDALDCSTTMAPPCVLIFKLLGFNFFETESVKLSSKKLNRSMSSKSGATKMA